MTSTCSGNSVNIVQSSPCQTVSFAGKEY
ncbi:hypothetical protein, partial [Escherichia coli]